MITVTYNNITLENVLTRAFRQEVIYDPSGTDHFFVRYTMVFEGLITGLARGPRGYCFNIREAATPQFLWKDLRQALLDPRHTVVVRGLLQDGTGNVVPETLFRCVPERINPDDPDRDLGHGPKPIHLETLGTIGSRAIRVRWEVQCEKLEWPSTYADYAAHFEGGHAALQTVLDNRWSVDEELDSNFYLTRMIRGSLRLSRPVARAGFDYRWITVPALEAGFKRVRMRYAVHEDGLTCEYEVVDRQVHTAAPWPATEMRVTNAKATERGVTYTGSCRVVLLGPPHVPRKALVIRAIQILDYFTQFLTQAQDLQKKAWIPIHIGITEEIGETNQVAAEIQYQYTPTAEEFGKDQFANQLLELGKDFTFEGQPWLIHALGQPPFPAYDPNLSWMPEPYGYNTWGDERDPAAVAVFQCYLQRPYHPWHAAGWWPAPQGAPEEITRPEQPDVVVERVEPQSLAVPEEERVFSDSHSQAIYTYCRMKSVYKIDHGRHSLIRSKKADDNSTAVVARLGEGSARRVILVDAERYGRQPELPPPEDYTDRNGVKGYLLHWTVECLPPLPSPAGEGKIRRLRAKYIYALDRIPPYDSQAYAWPVGRLPHVNDTSWGWSPYDSWNDKLGPNQDDTTT